jgi:hypothetical protein
VTGAIRSQPYFEETGAVSDCEGGVRSKKTGGLRRHGIVYSLDTGRLMGDPFVRCKEIPERAAKKGSVPFFLFEGSVPFLSVVLMHDRQLLALNFSNCAENMSDIFTQ